MSLFQECCILVLILILLLLYLLAVMARSTTRRSREVPSPRGLPIIGNLHQLSSLPYRSLHRLSLKYGPLMLIHLGSNPVLIVSNADVARAILKTHDRVFSGRPPSVVASHVLYGPKDVAFSPYGEYWRQARRVCTLHLLSHRRVRFAQRLREEEVRTMLDKIEKSTPSPVNMTEVVMELTNNVISRVAMGKAYKLGEADNGIKEVLTEFMELLGRFDIGEYVKWLEFVRKLSGCHGRMEKVARKIDGLLETVVEDHVRRRNVDGGYRKEEEESFMDVLLRVQEEEGSNNSTGFNLDRDSMKAIILDMFVAGTHTTAVLIDWAMAEMVRNPEVMMRAQEEVRKIGGAATMISEDETAHMVYLRMVIRETLRLHTPIPLLIPRESTEEVEVLGYPVSKGTRVMINVWAMGRDPEVWDNPEEFRPDRFRDREDKPMWDLSGINGYNFVPFGSGRRGCPGALFALSLVELVLANLVFRFDWDVPGRRNEELDMTESPGITVGRKCDLKLIARLVM